MSDLDFEELDKAINELYESLDADDQELAESAADNQNTEAAEVASRAHTRHKSGNKRESVDSVRREEITTQTSTSEATEPVDDNRQSKLPAKGRGHFMDMIHPSSDAQVQHKHNFAPDRQAELDAKLAEEMVAAEEEKATQPSKIAVTIADEPDEESPQPKTITVSDDDARDDSAGVEKGALPVDDEPGERSLTDDAREGGANKPEHGGEEAVRPKAVATHTAGRRGTQYANTNRRTGHDLVQPLPADSAVSSNSETVTKNAYETPFLPGAKVEKRPLGGGKAVESPVAEYVAGSSRVTTSDDHSGGDSGRSVAAPSHIGRTNRDTDIREGNRTSGSDDKPSNRVDSGRRSRSVSRQTDSNLDAGHNRAMRIAGRILLFLFIIIVGVLTGLAFYYYGG